MNILSELLNTYMEIDRISGHARSRALDISKPYLNVIKMASDDGSVRGNFLLSGGHTYVAGYVFSGPEPYRVPVLDVQRNEFTLLTTDDKIHPLDSKLLFKSTRTSQTKITLSFDALLE